MRRIHPSCRRFICSALLIAVAIVSGCRNQSSGLANPFLAPDRVPAPATRGIAPGSAQPYYSGDPLPTVQNDGWGASGPDVASTPQSEEPAARIASNEAAVAIPSDDDALRFARPAPPTEPEPITPIEPATTQPPVQVASVPQTVPVSQAAYDASPPSFGTAASGSWRSPSVAPQAPASGTPAAPQAVPPSTLAVPPSTMDVHLRAVPSPPPASGESTTPRIRLPGYGYSVPPQPAHSGVIQTAYIAELPAMSYHPSPAATASTSASRDGFRPRGSTR